MQWMAKFIRDSGMDLGALLIILFLSSCGGGESGGTTNTIRAAADTTAQNLTVGTAMTDFTPLTASGGPTPYTYSHTGALPTGLSFDSVAGVVSGTPTAAYAASNLTFSVRDANNNYASATSTVNFKVVAPWMGTRQLGVAGAYTDGRSVATDANGNVYVAGSTSGSLDGNTRTGLRDFFVTKYDSNGVKQFTRQLGAAVFSNTVGKSVATDASGNVYVAGNTTGGLDGNTLIASDQDFFVTKYDSNGVKQFTRQLGATGGGSTEGRSIAVDASGNVYVAGYTTGDLDGNTRIGWNDCFFTKYDSQGNKLYTRQLGVAGGIDTYGQSVATDADGNVYVAGTTFGGLDGNTLTGSMDFFFTKYDSNGNKLHTRQLGVAGAITWGQPVATDASGNVYVSGYTYGGLDGNTSTGVDAFLTKYDGNGNKLFTRQFGVAGATTWGQSIAIDANGNVYVAGWTNGGLDGNILTGLSNFFVTKYDSSGGKQYTRQLGVAGSDTWGYSVATDVNGNVYVAGTSSGGLDGNALTGTADFFVTKFDSAGVKQ